MRVPPVTPGERPPGFQPTNSTAGPKPQPGLSKLSASDRSPEPHPRSPGGVGAAQTTGSHSSPVLKPRFALLRLPPAPPPSPASGTAPTEFPSGAQSPPNLSSSVSVHEGPRQKPGPVTPPLPPQLDPSGGVGGDGHSGGRGC